MKHYVLWFSNWSWESDTNQSLKDALYDAASHCAATGYHWRGLTDVMQVTADNEVELTGRRLDVCKTWFMNKVDALYNEYQSGNYRPAIRVGV